MFAGESAADALSAMMSKNLKLGSTVAAVVSPEDRARMAMEQQLQRVRDLEAQLGNQQALLVSFGPSLPDRGFKVQRRTLYKSETHI